MIDLRTEYLGLELSSPLVASAGPLTGDLDTLLALQDAGAGAVVLPSLFEEQLVADSLSLHRILDEGAFSSPEASGYFPDLDDYNTGPDSYLGLVAAARQRLRIPVVASLNATAAGSWVRYARLLESAGASAIELNLYAVEADAERSAGEVEDDYVDLVRQVRRQVAVPLAVKLSPWFSSLAHFARRVVDAGADGLVLFNRFYQPDIDLESLAVVPRVELSHAGEIRLPLRWIAILHGRVAASLGATGGIHGAPEVVKALLAGADVAMMTSALLRHGPGHLARVERDLLAWMDGHGYRWARQMIGAVSRDAADDPSAFERAHYVQALVTYPR